MKAFRVTSKLTVHDTDPLVREHRVNHIHILPGVSMLDASYKTLLAANCPIEHVVLRQILFYEPVVTHAEMDRCLSVMIECDGTRGHITVRSVPSKDGKVLSQTDTLHMTANFVVNEQFGLPDLQPSQMQGAGEPEDLDSCYAVTRRVGIFHESFMQCQGSISTLPGGACLGQVNLHTRAAARQADFVLHPVFLDCATIVPLFHLRHRLDEAILFIPFAIEEFCARSFSGLTRMQVLVEKSEVGILEQEILRYSACLFDDKGRALARISNFGVKRVRSLDGIQRLVNSGHSSRNNAIAVIEQAVAEKNVTATPLSPAPTIESSAALAALAAPATQPSHAQVDPLHNLIGQIVANVTKSVWRAQDSEVQFFELGLDSLALLDISEALEKKLAIRLYPTLLFECPTVRQLAQHLRQHNAEQIALALAKHHNALPVPTLTSAPAPLRNVAMAQEDPLHHLIGQVIAQATKSVWRAQDSEVQFFELGLDSLALLDISEALEKQLAIRLYPTLLFECPTVRQLAQHLRQHNAPQIAHALSKLTIPADTPSSQLALAPSHSAPRAEIEPKEMPQTKTAHIYLPHWLPCALPGEGGLSGLKHLNPDQLAVIVVADLALWRALPDVIAHASVQIHAENAESALRSAAQMLLESDVPEIAELWFAGLDHYGVFALLKLLQKSARLTHLKHIKFISRNCHSVLGEPADLHAPHGVWGLLQSLSREYPRLAVQQCDIANGPLRGDAEREALRQIMLADSDSDSDSDGARQLMALRGAHVYHRQLLALHSSPAATASTLRTLRQEGVYLIAGGAGGVGLEFARYLRQHYAAQVILLGRRELASERVGNLAWQQAHRQLGEYGRHWHYFAVDISDGEQMRKVLQQVQSQCGALHGIIHSAMVLQDGSFDEMDEASLQRVMQPKMAGLHSLVQASADLSLDFLLLFSSMQSFIGNQQQANYACASTYLDGYALALGARRSYPVQVINWGFWSEVGAVATPVYRQLLARQGLHGLQSGAALACLAQVMASGVPQALILAAEDHVLQEMGMQYALEAMPAKERSVLAELPQPAVPNLSAAQIAAYSSDFHALAQAMPPMLALARARLRAVLVQIGAGLVGDHLVAAKVAAKVVDEVDAGKSVPPTMPPTAHTQLAREHSALLQVLQRQLWQHGESSQLDEIALLAAIEELPQAALQHFWPLLRAALLAYPSILRGEMSAFDALFPAASPELVRAVYGESAISQFYNQALAHAVLSLARAVPGQTLRIIEIGAGTGSTTVAVLDTLLASGIKVEYHYTELWDKLLLEAKAQLGARYPNLRFSFFDIGSAPEEQGITQEYDCVIATNVLHATRDLGVTLCHCKRLLKRGGALLINESVQVQEYSTYTFGLLPGWWSAQDGRLPDSPLADSAQWQRLLWQAGYQAVQSLIPAAPEIPHLAAQQVFIAFSDGIHLLPSRHMRLGSHRLPSPALAQLRPYIFPRAARQHDARLTQLKNLQVFSDAQGYLWLFLDHAPANTFHHALLEQLCAVLEYLQSSSSELAPCIYFSHVGDYFSLGGDRSEIMQRLMGDAAQHEQLRAFADLSKHLLHLLASMPILVVAVVHGTAQGGGLETLLATDLQFVQASVKLGLPEIKSGLIPGMGGLRYLQSKIGAARTKRLVLTGELISAQQAQEIGIISHAVDDPFASAFALQSEMQHLVAAVEMKKILALDNAALHSIDVDAWFSFLLQNTAQIDAQRIESAQALLQARQSVTQQREG